MEVRSNYSGNVGSKLIVGSNFIILTYADQYEVGMWEYYGEVAAPNYESFLEDVINYAALVKFAPSTATITGDLIMRLINFKDTTIIIHYGE